MRLGSFHSIETKRKMRIGQSGKNNNFFGHRHTEDTKKQMSEDQMGEKNSMFGKKGILPWNTSLIKETDKRLAKMADKKRGKPLLNRKHPNWKNGISSLNIQIKSSLEYHQWRSDVFARDDFTCQACGDCRGNNLNAHHIKSFSSIIESNNIITLEQAFECEELWNIDNGITLCQGCHKAYYNKIWKVFMETVARR